MVEPKTLRGDTGQLMIVGVEGPALSQAERAWLRLLQPAGVILFRRNIETARQTASLLREITDLISAPMFRCVDVEGGLVDRLRDVVAPISSAAAVAATGNEALFRKHGQMIGRSARLLGFNTTFAPVVDLALPASKAVMRTRVASADPNVVTGYARAFLDGLESEHVLGCLKHFPGLGGGTLDSHHATPTIERTLQEMRRSDLVPFRELADITPMVMVSHASYPRAARNAKPASISPFWIAEVLRKRIGYRGLVISDDMEMGGVRARTPIEDAAVAAIAAGTDMVEICKEPALVFAAYEAVLSEAERSPGFRRRVQAAAGNVRNHKQRLIDPRLPRIPSDAQMEKLRGDVVAFAESIPKGNA